MLTNADLSADAAYALAGIYLNPGAGATVSSRPAHHEGTPPGRDRAGSTTTSIGRAIADAPDTVSLDGNPQPVARAA